VIHQSPIEM